MHSVEVSLKPLRPNSIKFLTVHGYLQQPKLQLQEVQLDELPKACGSFDMDIAPGGSNAAVEKSTMVVSPAMIASGVPPPTF